MSNASPFPVIRTSTARATYGWSRMSSITRPSHRRSKACWSATWSPGTAATLTTKWRYSTKSSASGTSRRQPEQPNQIMPDPAIKTFALSIKTITVGENATLSWEVENATGTTQISIEGTPPSANLAPIGNQVLTPAAAGTLTYKLIIKDPSVSADFYESGQA